MAIFEKENKGGNEYVALLDTAGDLIAFISPVKGVDPQILVDKMTQKGLIVELRESKGDKLDFDL